MSAPSSSRTLDLMWVASREATSSEQVDPLGQRLLLEDGGPGLELGGVDLHPHAPLEAGAEPLLQPLQLLGAAIAGEHDLDVLLVEGVEGVEELLGGLVRAGEELHVVDEQRGALPVLAAELVDGVAGEGVDEVVGVALRGDDGDAGARACSRGWRWRWRGAGGSCRGRSRRGGRAGSRRGPASGPRPGRRRRRSGSTRRPRRCRRGSAGWGGSRRDRAARRGRRPAAAGGGAPRAAERSSTTNWMRSGAAHQPGHELVEPGPVVVVDEVAVERVGGADLEPVVVEPDDAQRREPAPVQVLAQPAAQVLVDAAPVLGRRDRRSGNHLARLHAPRLPSPRPSRREKGRTASADLAEACSLVVWKARTAWTA